MTKCSTEGKGWAAWMYTDWRCVMVVLLDVFVSDDVEDMSSA